MPAGAAWSGASSVENIEVVNPAAPSTDLREIAMTSLLAKEPTVVRERLDSVTSFPQLVPGKRSGVCKSKSVLTITNT